MKRRRWIQGSAALGLAAAAPLPILERLASAADARPGGGESAPRALHPPAQGNIKAAFLLSDGAVIIDFCGPMAVFQAAGTFDTYTVAETSKPIRSGGGMKILPDYTFANAPAPNVLVIPAQNTDSPAALDWIRKVTKTTDVTMSVCVGAQLLAKTGLLSGKSATTHHNAYKTMAMEFPDVHVKRGARFVEDGNVASAGGLSSGIDLALHVVERYYGRQTAKDVAFGMEYQGQGWLNPDSNDVYAQAPVGSPDHPVCPVCEMEVDTRSPQSVYKGKTYYFCSDDHKKQFDAAPEKFLQFESKP